MTKTIVVAGKGGVGKTAISALLVDTLSKKGVVLAIDADPSTNLNAALGVPLKETVGRVREEMSEYIKKGSMSPTVSKQDYLDTKIREALVEAPKFDLLAMGRPEGPGCYCASNQMLRLSMGKMSKSYPYMVVDSEAGMEHISRQTTQEIDFMLAVSDPTMRGLTAAARMKDLIKEMRTKVGKIGLAVNRVRNGLPQELKKAIDEYGLELVDAIPEDPELADLEIKGKAIVELPANSPLRKGVEGIIGKFGL
jgi:CO dehydrogenase maturation factor